jgi:hypothetical protein
VLRGPCREMEPLPSDLAVRVPTQMRNLNSQRSLASEAFNTVPIMRLLVAD